MTSTERKLNEANFFLLKLEKTYYEGAAETILKDFSPDKTPESHYYFSAFISAARSVTWIMKKEFSKVKGWQEWYDSRLPTSEEMAVMRKITDLRNSSVKESPLNPKAHCVFRDATLSEIPSTFHEFERLEPNDQKPNIPETLKTAFRIKITPMPKTEKEAKEPKSHEFDVVLDAFSWTTDDKSSNTELLALCKAYLSILQNLVTECLRLFPSTEKT